MSIEERYKKLKKKFPNIYISIAHGKQSSEERNLSIHNFKNGKSKILLATTVVEVGVDITDADIIIIECSNRYGLAQLHQLRGRVGRGEKQGTCILLFKDGLSKNAIKRIKILKNSDDGFFIAEEDMKLRGYGDLVGYQQSGLKNFRFADPVIHDDLFKLAEKYIFNIRDEINQKKYSFLLKLFDKAEIINVNKL